MNDVKRMTDAANAEFDRKKSNRCSLCVCIIVVIAIFFWLNPWARELAYSFIIGR